MARIFSSGFELNSITANMEWDAATGVTISSSTVRSGGYSGRVSSLVSGTNQRFRTQFKTSGSNGPFYFRFYFRVATLPTAANRIFALSSNSTAGTAVDAYITLDNTGALTLFDDAGQIGTASVALSTGVWYRIEVLFDRTQSAGSRILRARIDGTEFAVGTAQTFTTSIFHLFLGGNLNSEAQTTGDWFFDDVAINDTTGTSQLTYPGAGSIIHLYPNATGDSNGFLTQVGGTVGAANNYTRVNETTPNDATSYNASTLLSAEDLLNVTNSGLGATDIIALVAVGVRMTDLVGADATAAFKVEAEKVTGGTKSQSAAIIPNSTTWKTNATTAPLLHPLIMYKDPDGSSWTQATIDTMQIGYIQTATNVQSIAVSDVWALVESNPAPVFNGSGRFMGFFP
jgi:hypothetical protein